MTKQPPEGRNQPAGLDRRAFLASASAVVVGPDLLPPTRQVLTCGQVDPEPLLMMYNKGDALRLLAAELDQLKSPHPLPVPRFPPVCPVLRFLAEAEAIFAANPHLNSLILDNIGGMSAGHRPDIAQLAASPYLRRFKHLELARCLMGLDGLRSFLASEHLAGLKSLTIDEDWIGDRGLRLIANSPRLPALTKLVLRDNRIGPTGARALAESPYLSGIETLCVADNPIKDDGVIALASSARFPRLQALSLENNEIGAAGARALSESLYLETLRSLSFSEQHAGPSGEELLRERFGSRVFYSDDRSAEIARQGQEWVFLRALARFPDDDASRLRFARWLDERNDSWGEYVRVEWELTKTDEAEKEDVRFVARNLLASHERQWLAPLHNVLPRYNPRPPWYTLAYRLAHRHRSTNTYSCRGGVVASLDWTVRPFVEYGAEVFQKAPTVCGAILSCHLDESTWAVRLASTRHLARLTSLELVGLPAVAVEALAASRHLANLRSLTIRGSQLELHHWMKLLGSPHLGNLTALGLPKNTLKAETLRALASTGVFSRLERLDLSSNGLDEEGIAALTESPDLARLVSLDLSGNPLREDGLHTLSQLVHLTGLQKLTLEDTSICAGGIAALAASNLMSRLTILDLRNNAVADAGLATLASSSRARSLRTLSLTNNSLGSEGARAIARSPQLVNLSRLDLAANKLRDDGLEALIGSSHLERLRHLDVGENEITAEGMKSFAVATGPDGLTVLRLRGNTLGEGMNPLARTTKLPDLRLLDATECGIDSEGVAALVTSPVWPHLTGLQLSGNPIGDRGIATLASTQTSSLRVLYLANARVGSRGAKALAASPHLANLVALDVRDNSIPQAASEALRTRFGRRVRDKEWFLDLVSVDL